MPLFWDASDTNLDYVADNTTNYCNDILHASHHGSINGAHLEFIKKANAQYTLISTKTGVYENSPHPTALKRYKDHTAKHVPPNGCRRILEMGLLTGASNYK